MEVPHGRRLARRSLLRQPLPIDEPVARLRVDREVADVERGEVLEEVGSLRRRDLEVAEARFDDGARPRDLVPGDGNAEPRIGRPPSSDSDQEVGKPRRDELGVEP